MGTIVVNNLEFEDVDGQIVRFEGGSGGSQPAPNSVGSEQIKDGSVGKVDVDEEVQEGLDELNNISITDEELEDIFKKENQEENQDAGYDAGADEPDPDDI